MNYVHSCHYVPELTEVLGLANKIIKYVKTFEK
jgi:ribosomal protein L30/L7E